MRHLSHFPQGKATCHSRRRKSLMTDIRRTGLRGTYPQARAAAEAGGNICKACAFHRICLGPGMLVWKPPVVSQIRMMIMMESQGRCSPSLPLGKTRHHERCSLSITKTPLCAFKCLWLWRICICLGFVSRLPPSNGCIVWTQGILGQGRTSSLLCLLAVAILVHLIWPQGRDNFCGS